MSARHFITLARRMWAVREQLEAAYMAANREAWAALNRRHEKLQELVLNYATREGVEA